MGVNFSYLLYFKREHLWEALQGVVDIAEKRDPPVIIYFPDHKIQIPLGTLFSEERSYQYDDPELNFAAVLKFEEDETINDWIYADYRMGDSSDRNPPGPDQDTRIGIGYIYLTVFNDLSQRLTLNKPSDLVLFDFGTTGTKMSMLFDYSTSIRKTFIELLEKHKSVCGLFNRENGGDLFWFKGRHFDNRIEDAYTQLEEIEELLDSGWVGEGNDQE
jgi:hypothetical protein